MDSRIHLTENSQENAAPEEQTHQLPVAPVAVPPFATASLSHFTAVQHATHSFPQHRISSLFASPARISYGSTISANPLQSPLTFRAPPPFVPAMLSLPPSRRWPMAFEFKFSVSLFPSIIPSKLFEIEVSGNADPGPFGDSDRSTPGPDPSLDPPTGAACPSRHASIVWFRGDLRLPDNECLNAAHKESTSVLHVYCFDPRCWRGIPSSDLVYIFSSLLQCVSDLRRRLRDHGSDIVFRVGQPEKVLPEMARAVGAEVVYAHREEWPWTNEVKSEELVEAAMKEEGMEVKYFFGNTLFHIDDLPFKLEHMPTDYFRFKERVQGVKVRKPIAVLDQLKGLPKRDHVDPGEIPTLKDLGVTDDASMAQDVKAPPEVGGESEALQGLKKFAAQYQAQRNKGIHIDEINVVKSIHEIGLFTIGGCLSSRVMFEELNNVISAASMNDDGGSSSTVSNCFMDFLVTRDYWRFFSLTLVKQGALV